jgi:hypothetical protein
MTLGELAEMLQGADWFEERMVCPCWLFGGGFAPVRGNAFTDSFFILDVSYGSHKEVIYLSVRGKVSSKDLVRTMKARSMQTQTEFKDLEILSAIVWK